MKDRPALFEITPQTAAAVELLGRCPAGGVVTYRSLAQAIGEDAQGHGRHHVARARHILQRERRMVFEAVENRGLRHVPPAERLRFGEYRRRRALRQARRGLDELKTVTDLDTPLDDRQRLRLFVEQQGLHAVLHEAARDPETRAVGGSTPGLAPPVD